MERAKKTLSRFRAAGAALALLSLLAIESSPPMPSYHDSSVNGLKPLPGFGGLRVAVDTETGEKIPAPPLRLETLSPELRAALQRTAKGLILVRRADGSKYVNLEGRFMSGIAVSVGPAGATSYCTTAPNQSVAAHPGKPHSTRHEER